MINFESAALTPNVVNVKGSYIIRVVVYDDDFEFAESSTIYDEKQGFGNIEQTIGGKLVDI